MTGDQPDMLVRLKAVLPARWFADETPVLDGMLTGLAWSWSWIYATLDYVRAQTRIATASGVWLDVVAQDFFARRLSRRSGEQDASLRRRIRIELVRERGTRAAIIAVLTDLTGRAPAVFEPARPADTGGYASLNNVDPNRGGGMGWGVAGGWGNLTLPFQCFITAYRPHESGIASVAGWSTTGLVAGLGGYGIGAIEYASLAMVQGHVTDADIRAAITNVLPVTAIGWTRISN